MSLSLDDAWTALLGLNTAIESIEAAKEQPEIAQEIEKYEGVGRKIAARFRAKGYEGVLIDMFLGRKKDG